MKVRIEINNKEDGFIKKALKTVRLGTINSTNITPWARRLFILLFVTSIVFSVTMPVYSQNVSITGNQTNEKKYATGYIVPFPNDPSIKNKGEQITVSGYQPLTSLPSIYDLRPNKVTSVKNQNPAGTCWAFATYGSLESYLMPNENWDFSENNLKNTHGFDKDPNYGGGNQFMSTAYLARWSCPVA
jgi:C1A family cysteine protease